MISPVRPLWPYGLYCQAPLSMGFSRQECWSGLLFPSPGDLPHPGVTGRFLPTELWGKPFCYYRYSQQLALGHGPFDSQADSLTLPTCERLGHSWALCVGNDALCLLLTSLAQKFTRGGPESQIAVAYLFIDMTGDNQFYTTCEMIVRKWNQHIPLPKACHSRRHFQELNGLLLCFLTSPHLWSIKEPSI